MARRVVPNIEASDPGATRDFFVGLLGFEVAMDLDWGVNLQAGRTSAKVVLVASLVLTAVFGVMLW